MYKKLEAQNEEIKTADYVLVDIADEMLNVSRKRFAGLENIQHEILDYTKQLPKGEFDTIISALSIHHLDEGQKTDLFERIYEKLPVGGIFVNYDQFCAGTQTMNQWFDSYWEKQIYHSGLTDSDIEQWKERKKLDKECSVEEEIEMLKKCGFSDVKCLYSYHNFSINTLLLLYFASTLLTHPIFEYFITVFISQQRKSHC